jgi:hypothetical protein
MSAIRRPYRTGLGPTTVTTDANGNATFAADLSAGNLAGQWVTATATDPHGDISEFALDVLGSRRYQAGAQAETPLLRC